MSQNCGVVHFSSSNIALNQLILTSPIMVKVCLMNIN